jgi:hypothetical protein
LPLLSYTLDDVWTQMVKRDDGVLRLPAQSFELGGALVDRADAFLAAHPKSKDALRRIFTLKLATVREGEEPTRRRAVRSEFTDEEWRLINELADHPNRLLVTATPEAGETYAEVAHEAVFRRLGKLHDWIAAEREFLAWRTGLEAARRTWQAAPRGSKQSAMLMGLALEQAQNWLKSRYDDIPETDRDFIARSRIVSRMARRRRRALVGVLTFFSVVGLPSAYFYQTTLQQRQMLLSILDLRSSIIESQREKFVAAIEADETKADGQPGKATATILGEIAWYELYAREPGKALAAAERALSIVPGVLWIETIRAHALMFLDRREEALALYLAHKDKPIGNKSWQEAIAEDFEGLRNARLDHPLMAEIEKMLGVNREK